MANQPLVDWDSDLLECFEDGGTCCYGLLCCPCLASSVSWRFGESRCLPLCDVCTPALTTLCGIPFSVPPASLGLRAAIRNRYKIKGSLCGDIGVVCCCTWCAWCQMHREIKHRKKAPNVVNVQTATVFAAQPAPVIMMPQQVFTTSN